LRTSNADVICLQEIVPGDTSRDVVAFLSGLAYQHAVAPIGATYKDGRMITSGVFSRYPILGSVMHMLPEESGPQAVEAKVKVGEDILTVFTFHFKHTHQREDVVQNVQTETLIKVLPKERAIVSGDFNAIPAMTSIKKMREILLDTDPADTPTLSPTLFDCPKCDMSLIPQTRLDYIFASPDLKTHSFKVERSAEGSDHFPVSVVVEL
jgi:endonuclease/exonuclease/phosphatase family metal-dependent hydrolase